MDLVIFGATGHLCTEKLLPALARLHQENLATTVRIFGVGRRTWDDHAWRVEVRTLLTSKKLWHEDFGARLFFVAGDYREPQFYQKLVERKLSDARVFYLAVQPEDFCHITQKLAESALLGFGRENQKIVIEKPFGQDFSSAQALNAALHRFVEETQIYRIDHYLGKAAIQNLLVLRFANLFLEPIWNRHYIECVQILHSETAGIGTRGGFYDTVGALRDMVQSHLLQILALIAMEPPVRWAAEAIRDEKVKALRAIRAWTPEAVARSAVRAQYLGYREEPKVAPESTTETFAAVKFFLENWRWQGVPFYVRTGKRLPTDHTAVFVQFKAPPQRFFPSSCDLSCGNLLHLSLQPQAGVQLGLAIKPPNALKPRTVFLDAAFDAPVLDAYATLLLDVFAGERMLFLRYDEVAAAWQAIDPIVEISKNQEIPLYTYSPNSWGPVQSALILEPGQSWLEGTW